MVINNTSDQLTVANYFSNAGRGENGLELIRFADGTFWRYADVLSRTALEQGASDAQSLPPGVLTGDTSSLITAINPAATQPIGDFNTPSSVAESIAVNQARFEQGLKDLRLSVDGTPSGNRPSLVQSSTLPLLWNIQDALLRMQLAKNSDGQFSTSISLDGRALADLQRATTFVGATSVDSGRLDAVTRIDQPAQFNLASFQ